MGEDDVEHHHLVLEHIAVEAQVAAILVLEHGVGEPGLGIAGAAAAGHGLGCRLWVRRTGCVAVVGHGDGRHDPQATGQHQPVEAAHARSV
ncbi:hypothetical protein D3C76_1553830 [compost metagenome]